MNDWFKLITLALLLPAGNGAQTVYLGGRIDTLAAEMADVRERLARVEAHLAIPAAVDTSVAVTVKPADTSGD